MSDEERIAAVADRLKRAREEFQAAMKARDELLIELASPGGAVRKDVALELGVDPREAATIVHRASGAEPWRPPGARC